MTERTFISETTTYNCFQAHNLPCNETLMLEIENFEIGIRRTDEGIVVDIFDMDEEVRESSVALASTHAFNSDTLSYQDGDQRPDQPDKGGQQACPVPASVEDVD